MATDIEIQRLADARNRYRAWQERQIQLSEARRFQRRLEREQNAANVRASDVYKWDPTT